MALNISPHLNRLLHDLPAVHANTIIDTVNDLCWEHERQGFISGFRIACAWNRKSNKNYFPL